MKRLATVIAFTLAAAGVDAAVIPWTAQLSGENEVPPVSSSGFGTGTGTLDDDTGLFTWVIEWTNLSGAVGGVHFHAPANTETNAGIVINVSASAGVVSPLAGSADLSDAQVDGVKAGLWYINVHTTSNPAGEIRGQVMTSMTPVPLPATLPMLLGAGLLFGALKIGRKAV